LAGPDPTTDRHVSRARWNRHRRCLVAALRGFRTSAASGTRNFVGWWTYAGGTINSTLRHAIAAIQSDWEITEDNLPVRLRGEGVDGRHLGDAPGQLDMTGFPEDTGLWQDIGRNLPSYRPSKFQPLMPAWVERETLERYLLDLEGTRDWLARTASSRDGKAPTRGFGVAPRQFRIVVTATADHYLLANRFGHHLGAVWGHDKKPALGRLPSP
jgi:hypothetical protein